MFHDLPHGFAQELCQDFDKGVSGLDMRCTLKHYGLPYDWHRQTSTSIY